MGKDSRASYKCPYCRELLWTLAGQQQHLKKSSGCRWKAYQFASAAAGAQQELGSGADTVPATVNLELVADAFDADDPGADHDPISDGYWDPLDPHLNEALEQDESNTSKGHGIDEQSSTSHGNSRIVYEPFPGHAGRTLGIGTPKLERIHDTLASVTDVDKPSPLAPLLDPELWGLTHWLMTNGITATAREAFFKLTWVSKRNFPFLIWALRLTTSQGSESNPVEIRIQVHAIH
jgi:hypothetical protein